MIGHNWIALPSTGYHDVAGARVRPATLQRSPSDGAPMALPLLHRSRSAAPAGGATRSAAAGGSPPGLGARVPVVHRYGAVVIALVILVFGLLGFVGGLPFFSTSGQRILGLSSNGLLSTISVVTAAVLVTAVLRGARPASTVMMVVGALFLVSALANLAVLDTGLNVLAFRFSNVVFSILAGLVLLVLGAYGRVGGHLPPDSPYAHPDDDGGGWDGGTAAELPSTPAELAADRAIRAAEVAAAQHLATPEQRRRVAAMARVRTQAERRQVWMELDRSPH